MASPKPLNQSLENALDLLELLAHGPALMSGEIAQALGLKPNTANNMLRTLFRRGYLTQDEVGRYSLGPQCFFVGQANAALGGLRQLALPDMLDLSRATGDNAFLGLDLDGRLYMVAHTEGTNVIRVSEPQRWQNQFHCCAAGKVVLAEKGLAWLRQVTRGEPLPKRGPNTLTTDEELQKEIDRIRREGHVRCINEGMEDIYAIGVAVRRRNGELIAGLSQSFPTFFVDQGKVDVDERIRVLHEYADRLTSRFEEHLPKE
jgi:IclR family KDG regulon transcriptional repressor